MTPFPSFTKVFLEEIEENIKAQKDAILGGNIPDYPEYKRLVGKLSGLMDAKQQYIELTNSLEQANDR